MSEEPQPPQISFRVGEILRHETFRCFRIIKVGTEGITVWCTNRGVIRKDPFLVTFKGVRFYVISQTGRYFVLRNITEQEYIKRLNDHAPTRAKLDAIIEGTAIPPENP